MNFTICDVFTDKPLQGNQLAVFGDGASVPEELQQPLAREINFSETVFVYPPDDPAHTARIRIYVPTAEIPFAGHPVIGTAIVLAAERDLDRLVLETGMGPIEISVDGGFATMLQPIPTVAAFPHAEELLVVSGSTARNSPSRCTTTAWRTSTWCWIHPRSGGARSRRGGPCPATDLDRQRGFGIQLLRRIGHAVEDAHVRPGADRGRRPATGSAAGPLACHTVRHGLVDLGTEITISQGAEIGRPSTLYARVSGNSPDAITEVAVKGRAVIVGNGQLHPPGVNNRCLAPIIHPGPASEVVGVLVELPVSRVGVRAGELGALDLEEHAHQILAHGLVQVGVLRQVGDGGVERAWQRRAVLGLGLLVDQPLQRRGGVSLRSIPSSPAISTAAVARYTLAEPSATRTSSRVAAPRSRGTRTMHRRLSCPQLTRSAPAPSR